MCPRKWFGQLGVRDVEKAGGSKVWIEETGQCFPKTARATSQESSSRKAEDIAAMKEVSVILKANQRRRKEGEVQS